MDEQTQRLIGLRRHHPAWMLLASTNGPLMLASMKSLIDAHPAGIQMESAVEHLALSMADHANDTEFNIGEDHALSARRELRSWIRRGLIVERSGELLATDALQKACDFVDALSDETMTSTASRLATVQRAIEELQSKLSSSKSGREHILRERIANLQEQLKDVQSGRFEVLRGKPAEEGIREVYQLAISLRADFRRVEDSYREADRTLRQRVLSERQNRGQVVDELLDGHDALVATPEGQVFENFHEQLVKLAELKRMKDRLREILDNENTTRSLTRRQRADLRQLVSRLVAESQRVIQARATSERDVRGFLKSGLADEQIRVGGILQEIFRVALEVDWKSQAVRRAPGPLPPVGVSIPGLPLVERLLVKQVHADDDEELDLTIDEGDLSEMDDEFWAAYHALDRALLFEQTIEKLRESAGPLTIADLAEALPPTHDLETLAYWLTLARQCGVAADEGTESIELAGDGVPTRFSVPRVELDPVAAMKLDAGELE
ncbi:DUF3375 family protein [Crateriforma conspicua]|uniref:DUF3375 domain-containing protein n=1 Tax=Crateriforma conspicua TaxID=2527996 RepID=A0A5C6FQN4_9PLAN|nr:DUF3375 family protein [Crateriforma conspicua]TWU64546.1 hypothetical protein V7x_00900 [Crateriforma conspicua]